MTRLDTVRRALARQVACTETQLLFAAARERHPDLELFSDPLAAVAFLNDTDLAAATERSAVTRALLEEMQTSGDGCWSALLLHAFFPGLLGLRGRFRPTAALGDEELDLLVLESFLEVAATLPLETQGRLAVVNLMFGTRKAVLRHVQQAALRARAERPLAGEFEDCFADPGADPEQLLLRREAERVLTPERIRAWVRELYRDEPEDDLLLVLGTYASGVPLITWVHQQWAGADAAELLRHYQRCRRRRSRLLDRMRERIRDCAVSHSPFSPALLLQEVG